MRWMSLCLMIYKKHIICLRWTPTQSEMCQCKKAKSFFVLIKLSAGENVFVWKKLQLDTASTTNTLALDYLQDLLPAGFDIHRLIKPSTAILCTYGGGMIKPVGQIELTCDTQGKLHNLQFQLLSRDVMGSQPPLPSGSD